MKKLIAGLLGLALSVTFVGSSVAQNLQSRYDSYGIGQVSYSMNSGGSFYGQLFNNGSSAQWSLGFGSSQATAGTGIINWNSAGHVFLGNIGAAPTVSSCGSSPSLASGSDQAGDLTLGSDAVTTCTLTFQAAFTAIPHCFVNNRTSKLVALAEPTASTLVIVGTGAGGFGNTNNVIDYMCMGHAS